MQDDFQGDPCRENLSGLVRLDLMKAQMMLLMVSNRAAREGRGKSTKKEIIKERATISTLVLGKITELEYVSVCVSVCVLAVPEYA